MLWAQLTRFFNFITAKVCYTFAIAIYSVLGGQIAAALGMLFMWATIDFAAPGTIHPTNLICAVLVIGATGLHYILFGLSRLWGRRWELKELRIINDHIKKDAPLDELSTPVLEELALAVERLPSVNTRLAMAIAIPVVVIGVLLEMLRLSGLLHGLLILKASITAWAVYVMFTHIITEIISTDLRRHLRRLLARRHAWHGSPYASPLNMKLAFLFILMLAAILITHGVSTGKMIASPFLVMLVFTILMVGVGVIMYILVFIALLNSLKEIEHTALSLSEEKPAELVSSSLDREFIAISESLYSTAQKITAYQGKLTELNRSLEHKVEERTAELIRVNQELQREIGVRKQIETALMESERRYRELSIKDSLTGLYNMRHFHTQIESEVARAKRYGEPFSLLLLDIDNFKDFNDRWGHLEGDKVLVALADTIRECMRRTDSAYRYGGEEFTVALPSTSGAEAVKVAERIRIGFAAQSFQVGDSTVTLSASVGVTQYRAPEELTCLLDRADKHMYTAKRHGKNRIFYA
ncbi:MAG: diguanylate cyclase [Syntrophaceae bacterium]